MFINPQIESTVSSFPLSDKLFALLESRHKENFNYLSKLPSNSEEDPVSPQFTLKKTIDLSNPPAKASTSHPLMGMSSFDALADCAFVDKTWYSNIAGIFGGGHKLIPSFDFIFIFNDL